MLNYNHQLIIELMFERINGAIAYARNGYAVLDVNGVGYKVFVTNYTLGRIAGLSQETFYVHTHVREDALALFGFLTLEELDIFELLLSVSGVGPKVGMAILNIATPNTIKTAVINEDPSILTKVSGIGKKTAERIIVDLKNKVTDLPTSVKAQAVGDSDALEALVGMGYSVTEAREALKSVSKEISDIGERVKQALKNLAK